MIEITVGTIEEQIIKFLQKTYPISISDLENTCIKKKYRQGATKIAG